jgi:regulator of sigma E protease
LLAFIFALIVWQVGRPVGEAESTQVIGYVAEKSPAADAGVKVGDKVLSVDGHHVSRFAGMGADSITWRVVRSEGDTIAMEVERDGMKQTLYPKPRVEEKTNWWNRKNLRQIGIGPAISAVVGQVTPDSPASRAGLRPDDTVIALNGQKLYGAEDLYEYAAAQGDQPLTLTVQRGSEQLALPFDPTGVKVNEVAKDSPAAAAGLKKGDVIIAMDDRKPTVAKALVDYVGNKGGVPITLTVQRSGSAAPLMIKVTPEIPAVTPDPEKRAKIGFMPEEDDGLEFLPMGRYRVVHPNPFEQIHAGVMSIVNTVDAVLSRKSSISVQHMGGPVMMMNAYYRILSGPEGIRMALWFSVVLNVNLALLNLLPIPVLDGGHITLAAIEAVRRKPVNVRILEFVQTACAMVIIGFMLFIAFFDVQDLPFVGGGKPTGVKFQKSTPPEVAK